MTSEAERLMRLFDRLRAFAFEENPLAAESVTMPQLTLLEALATAPGSTLSELAGALGVTVPTASVGVRRLEDAGLVERRPNPEDARSVQLWLTARGERLVGEARDFRQTKMRALLRGLRAPERAMLLDLFERAMAHAAKSQFQENREQRRRE